MALGVLATDVYLLYFKGAFGGEHFFLQCLVQLTLLTFYTTDLGVWFFCASTICMVGLVLFVFPLSSAFYPPTLTKMRLPPATHSRN